MPLAGRRILVTRPRAQAGRLADLLARAGAEVLLLPLAEILPPRNPAALLQALEGLTAGDWIAFSSANAVAALGARLPHGRFRLAAIGPGTANALLELGLHADLVPADHAGPSLAAALLARGARQVLLPQAANADPGLAETLRAGGAAVQAVEAYRCEALADPGSLPPRLDAIPLTSAESARRLVDAFGARTLAERLASGCRCVALGPATAQAMHQLGLPVAAVATQARLEALVDCLAGLWPPTGQPATP